MKFYFWLSMILLAPAGLAGQVYLKEQSQHRFAQTHVGLHYRCQPASGEVAWEGQNGLSTGVFPAIGNPQLSIGGLHFWGRLNFIMHFDLPVHQEQRLAPGVGIKRTQFADLGAHFYPWRVAFGKLRPFVGGTYAAYALHFSRDGQSRSDGWLSFFPEAGLSFASRNWQLNLKAAYFGEKERSFYVGPRTPAHVKLPPWQLTVGVLRYFDTTLREEAGLKDGTTYYLEQELGQQGRLNSLSLGLGASSGIFLHRPSFEGFIRQSLPQHKTAIHLDFGLGYLLHKPGVHLGLSYRNYNSRVSSFGLQQIIRRSSLALEGFKFLLNYQGFAPFAGLSIAYDRWAIGEFEGEIQVGETVRTKGVQPGLVLGWDILPSPLETWVLRTNLRYYPLVKINGPEGRAVRADQLEFNFIQLVLYPQRMYHVGKKKRHERS